MSAATIGDRLANDDLDGALAAAAARVKAAPQDAPARLLMAMASAVDGDLDKAETHAKLASRISPADSVGIGVFRSHLRGLYARDQWWSEGAAPEFPMGMTICDELALKLNVALRAGDAAAAAAALEELEGARGQRPAIWNGNPVEDLRDLDDRLPHAFEIVTGGGAYLWLDFSLVREMAFQPPSSLFDLACRRARVTLTDDSAADVLVMAACPGAMDAAHKLARRTDFEEVAGGLTIAKGQRAYLAGDDMVGLLAAETIRFEGGGDA
ncbi:MAG: type VI secretion system accessory protein TagJ [Pikeienuella sp.]